MGRIPVSPALLPGQPSGSRRWHPCCRRCLLKGCERWFLPPRPQARYCSPDLPRCRTSTGGPGMPAKLYQSHRPRQGTPPRTGPTLSRPCPTTISSRRAGAPDTSTSSRLSRDRGRIHPNRTDPPRMTLAVSEGQRPAEIPQNSCGLPCHRPGCYVLFLPSPPFSRSTFLFQLVPSGVTTSSPARSPTQAPTPPGLPGLSVALVADHPRPARSCRHVLRMPSSEN